MAAKDGDIKLWVSSVSNTAWEMERSFIRGQTNNTLIQMAIWRKSTVHLSLLKFFNGNYWYFSSRYIESLYCLPFEWKVELAWMSSSGYYPINNISYLQTALLERPNTWVLPFILRLPRWIVRYFVPGAGMSLLKRPQIIDQLLTKGIR